MFSRLAFALMATGLVGAVAISTDAEAARGGPRASAGRAVVGGGNMMARGNFGTGFRGNFTPGVRNSFGNAYGAYGGVSPGRRYAFRGRRGFGGFYPGWAGYGWDYGYEPYYAASCDPYYNYYYDPYSTCTSGFGWGYY